MEEDGEHRDGASTPSSQKSSVSSKHMSLHEEQTGAPGEQGSMWDQVEKNPFTMPTDEEVFALRETEKKRKLQERDRLKSLKVHEKTTWSSRMGQTRRLEDGQYDLDEETIAKMNKMFGLDKMVLGNRERRREKENMDEFIAKKREMFLVQMSLDTKRAEIKKLEERAQQREEALKRSEKMLGDDAVRFDAFLKENDAKAVEAIRKAEIETKAKQDKVQEIKKLNAAITALKSEMSKYEENLDDCAKYKEFLDKLTPQEWFDEQKDIKLRRKQERRTKREAEKKRIWDEFQERLVVEDEAKLEAVKEKTKKMSHADREKKISEVERELLKERERREKEVKTQIYNDFPKPDENTSSGEEIPMFFQDPKQLLDIFASLEESNLFLIQNSQETEEALEELKQKHEHTKQKMEAETENLKNEIASLKGKISLAEERDRELSERASQKLGTDHQEGLLELLGEKVKEVYTRCIESDTNIGTLQMLTNIESRLEQLLKQVATMDKTYVETAEKEKEKKRRARVRDQKIEQQKKMQEERIQKALQRSRAPVHKKTGKPVMTRSQPEKKKRKQEEEQSTTAEEEDIREFFV